MTDEGLVRYIRERLGEGYTEAEIRAVLLQHGHPHAEVDAAFHHIHHEHSHAPFFILSLLFLVALALIVSFLLHMTGRAASSDSLKDVGKNVTNETSIQKQPPTAVALAAELKERAERESLSADELYYESVHAATTSARSVSDGILLCSVNKEVQYKNYCLQELAKSELNAAYCDVIGDTTQRDDCYLNLVFKGEDQYCEKLVLKENQRVCQLLLGE